jgi:hypothetical protein
MNQQQALPKAANFGDLALNQGTNMEIDAFLAHIGTIKRVGKNNTPCQKCILKDQGGNQEKVTIWMGRTGTALADLNLNKWLTFNLSASKYRGENQYGGFWQMEAPVIQAPPAVPSQPIHQAVQESTQQGMQMPTTYAYPVTPETQKRMARSVGVEAASRVVAAMLTVPGTKLDPLTEMLTLSDAMAIYINKGVGTPPEPQTQEPYEQGVCPSCQLLRVDCTCPTQDFVR